MSGKILKKNKVFIVAGLWDGKASNRIVEILLTL